MILYRVGGVVVLVTLLTTVVYAVGQERTPPNLRGLAERQRVAAVSYCRGAYGAYAVALGDGSVRTARPHWSVGDRASVVFANLEELRMTIRAQCQD